MFLFIIALAIFIYFLLKKGKTINAGDLVLVTGGVKCGKSTFAVWYSLKRYRQAVFKWKVEKFFYKLFHKKGKKLRNKPLLYSNIPLSVDYVPLTTDLLQRKKRFEYGSVIYCGEVSLVADSMMYKDAEQNENLTLFNKLIGHELQGKGGCIVYDTQAISDCHFSVKRTVSNYFYIHHLTKIKPFFIIAHIVEERYSDDGSISAKDSEDIETKLKWVIIPCSIWRKFDSYCYSILTDDLECENNVIKGKSLKSLKANDIVSFRVWKNKKLNKESENEDETQTA